MSLLLGPARDGRLSWQHVSKLVWQLMALDGGTTGTVVLMPKAGRYSASTHRTYLGQYATEIEARRAVEDKVKEECA
jgi:hypothetical protein